MVSLLWRNRNDHTPCWPRRTISNTGSVPCVLQEQQCSAARGYILLKHMAAQPRRLPLHTVFHCLFLFVSLCLDCPQVFSAWISVPQAGSASLGLPPWLPRAVPGISPCSRQHLCPADVSVPWLTEWGCRCKPLAPSCGVCSSPSLAVPPFAWKPGHRRRREEKACTVAFTPRAKRFFWL